MRGSGDTTVIRRVLERRATRTPNDASDSSVSVASILRVLPPPRALLAFERSALCEEIEGRLVTSVLDLESVTDDETALHILATDLRPLVFTDSPELIRRVRKQSLSTAPFIVYVAELDETADRAVGLVAGADEAIGRRASEEEWSARVGSARRIAELESVLRTTLSENRKLSAIDDLTRVASRRFFAKRFPREVGRAMRYQRALSLVLCDIDWFKRINDSLGHAAGDDILRQFGALLQRVLRTGVDWVARIGGEEFAIVLPETGDRAAVEVARRVRATVADAEFVAQGKTLRVTASFGVCTLGDVPAAERKVAEFMLKAADSALYCSKREGRNRVTASSAPSSPQP
jgi:diguanylate cyclase (GGDEF)-like protein